MQKRYDFIKKTDQTREGTLHKVRLIVIPQFYFKLMLQINVIASFVLLHPFYHSQQLCFLMNSIRINNAYDMSHDSSVRTVYSRIFTDAMHFCSQEMFIFEVNT